MAEYVAHGPDYLLTDHLRSVADLTASFLLCAGKPWGYPIGWWRLALHTMVAATATGCESAVTDAHRQSTNDMRFEFSRGHDAHQSTQARKDCPRYKNAGPDESKLNVLRTLPRITLPSGVGRPPILLRQRDRAAVLDAKRSDWFWPVSAGNSAEEFDQQAIHGLGGFVLHPVAGTGYKLDAHIRLEATARIHSRVHAGMR